MIVLPPLPLAVDALAVGYVLGSIPFGLLLTKAAGLGDVRSIGSGNIGATNVLRTGRKDIAAATLLLDALKGLIPVLIFSNFVSYEAAPFAGFAAFLGHIFPVWLKFKGGKGVATFLGCLFGFDWHVGLIFVAVWLSIAVLTRYSSLSALIASALSVLFVFWGKSPIDGLVTALMAAILWAKHKENIARLRAGTEGRIGRKK